MYRVPYALVCLSPVSPRSLAVIVAIDVLRISLRGELRTLDRVCCSMISSQVVVGRQERNYAMAFWRPSLRESSQTVTWIGFHVRPQRLCPSIAKREGARGSQTERERGVAISAVGFGYRSGWSPRALLCPTIRCPFVCHQLMAGLDGKCA